MRGGKERGKGKRGEKEQEPEEGWGWGVDRRRESPRWGMRAKGPHERKGRVYEFSSIFKI